MNTDQHEILLGDNEATEILNFRLDKTGSLVVRDGLTPISGAEGGANAFLQLGAWRNPENLGVSQILAKLDNGNVVRYDENTTSLVTIASGFSATARGGFSNAQNYVVYADGSRVPVVYDGSDAYPMGIANPSSPPSVVGTGSGDWSGDWSFAITWTIWEVGAESGRSEGAPITLTSDSPQVTRPSPPSDATGWRVWARDDSDPNGLFYLLTPTPIPVGTSDWTPPSGDPDTLLLTEASFTPPTIAPDLEHVAFFNGVYFGSIGDELYWSAPLGPGTWPGENYTRLPFEGNDRVMGMAALQDSLVIFGRRNILVVSGYYPAFTITRVDAAIGLVGEDAFQEIEGQVAFLSDEGVRIYPGLGVIGEGIQRTLGLKSIPQKEAAILRHSPRENALWLTIDGSTYVLFLRGGGVSRYDFNPTAILSGGRTGLDPNILTDEDGEQAYSHLGQTDAGEEINVIWKSKIFQMDNPEATKFIRRIGLFASRGSEANVTVQLLDTAGAVATVVPTSQAAISSYWDSFNWGEASWSSEGITYFIGALPMQQLNGMTLQVRIGGSTLAGTEFIPPFTILYREALRFLGR